MLVTSKTHRAVTESYEVRLGELRASYEARIAELQARIEDLRRMVFSPTQAAPTQIAREADAIITPTEPPLPTEADYGTPDELREQDLIFSGQFEDLIN